MKKKIWKKSIIFRKTKNYYRESGEGEGEVENKKRRGRRRRGVEKNYLEWCLLPSLLLPSLATFDACFHFSIYFLPPKITAHHNKRRWRRRRDVEKDYRDWCLLPPLSLPSLANIYVCYHFLSILCHLKITDHHLLLLPRIV